MTNYYEFIFPGVPNADGTVERVRIIRNASKPMFDVESAINPATGHTYGVDGFVIHLEGVMATITDIGEYTFEEKDQDADLVGDSIELKLHDTIFFSGTVNGVRVSTDPSDPDYGGYNTDAAHSSLLDEIFQLGNGITTGDFNWIVYIDNMTTNEIVFCGLITRQALTAAHFLVHNPESSTEQRLQTITVTVADYAGIFSNRFMADMYFGSGSVYNPFRTNDWNKLSVAALAESDMADVIAGGGAYSPGIVYLFNHGLPFYCGEVPIGGTGAEIGGVVLGFSDIDNDKQNYHWIATGLAHVTNPLGTDVPVPNDLNTPNGNVNFPGKAIAWQETLPEDKFPNGCWGIKLSHFLERLAAVGGMVYDKNIFDSEFDEYQALWDATNKRYYFQKLVVNSGGFLETEFILDFNILFGIQQMDVPLGISGWGRVDPLDDCYGGPHSNTWTITWNNNTTPDIPWNATVADIQTAIQALADAQYGVGVVTVTCAGVDHGGSGALFDTFIGTEGGDGVTISMTGLPAGIDLGVWTVNFAFCGGSNPGILIKMNDGFYTDWPVTWKHDMPLSEVLKRICFRFGLAYHVDFYQADTTDNIPTTSTPHKKGDIKLILERRRVTQNTIALPSKWLLLSGSSAQPSPLDFTHIEVHNTADDTVIVSPAKPINGGKPLSIEIPFRGHPWGGSWQIYSDGTHIWQDAVMFDKSFDQSNQFRHFQVYTSGYNVDAANVRGAIPNPSPDGWFGGCYLFTKYIGMPMYYDDGAMLPADMNHSAEASVHRSGTITGYVATVGCCNRGEVFDIHKHGNTLAATAQFYAQELLLGKLIVSRSYSGIADDNGKYNTVRWGMTDSFFYAGQVRNWRAVKVRSNRKTGVTSVIWQEVPSDYLLSLPPYNGLGNGGSSGGAGSSGGSSGSGGGGGTGASAPVIQTGEAPLGPLSAGLSGVVITVGDQGAITLKATSRIGYAVKTAGAQGQGYLSISSRTDGAVGTATFTIVSNLGDGDNSVITWWIVG